MQQAPRRTDLDADESEHKATRTAPFVPVWLIFAVVAIVSLILIVLIGSLAPTA